MKIHSSPSTASRFKKLTPFRLTLAVVLIGVCSSLPFLSFAQNETLAVKARPTYSVAQGGSFIIYEGDNGDTVCRDATIAESRSIRSTAGNYPLHQINHLEKSLSSPSATNAGLKIVLRATQQLEANQQAKAAFIAAAAKWEALIKDQITIVIDVDFGTSFFGEPFPGPNVLGATATQQLFFNGNYTDVRNRLNNHASTPAETTLYGALPATSVPSDIGSINTVLVASPLLRALGALPANAETDNTTPGTAPQIGFNSAFGFDFDPSDGITGNRTDFDAVAVHEMGHALGFNSETGARELDSSGPLVLTIWDLFRFRPGTANLNNFSTAQRILSSGGTQVHFAGGSELQLSTGRPDGTGGDGEQASHWKDDRFPGNLFIGIMDPSIQRDRREVMTTEDQTAVDRFGYLITPGTPPPNDLFVNAQTISGTSGSVTGTNVFATKEPNEPSHEPGGNLGGKSVWYRWTAPSSGSATLTTAGSNFDTLLAVYTGSSVGALSAVVKNDDVQLGVITTSSVQFNAVGGTTYQIAVDGFDADQGNITLNFTLPGSATPTPTPTPGPNTVQFNEATTVGNEAPLTTVQVNLNVTRTGNTAAGATVNFATSDGTASARSDYEAAIGTLNFGPGETFKSIVIFIVNDAYGEPQETFNVTLSNCVGCTLGSPVANTVTINSDEAVNGSNPVKDPAFNTDFFVRQQYLDFFNRAPDAPGLAFWKNQLDECTTQECKEIRRINVSAAFFLSIEFQETGYLVYKTWGAAFGTTRVGSTVPLTLVEFLPDQRRVGEGVIIGNPGADALLEANKVAYFNEFVARPAFVSQYPGFMTSQQFVDALNANAGGALSTTESQQLVDDLNNSVKNRAQVLRALVQDSDFHNAQLNRAFVLMQYFGYMRRNPFDSPEPTLDFQGYNFWLGKLNQFSGNFINAEMVKAFITSTEYQARFGP